MSRQRPATVKDIAQRAGVSRSSVSVVLNNAKSTVRVSQDTRARIEAIAAELGYSPNRTARALRRQQSGVIGFVPMPVKEKYRPFDLPVQFLLGAYIARDALSHGFHAVEVPVEIAASADSLELARFLKSMNVDGVVFHGADHVSKVRAAVELGIPVVELMRTTDETGASSVTVDPEPGIAAGLDYLLELGHSRIGFVGTASDHPNDIARKDAFIKRLGQRGTAMPADLVQELGRYSVEDGKASMQKLLTHSSPPTAVLAAGDILALGAMHALCEAGIRVPDDMSILSYDDAIVDNFYPPLTSIAQPFQAVSTKAMSIIAEQLATAVPAKPAHVMYPSELVVRSSTAALKRGGGSCVRPGHSQP